MGEIEEQELIEDFVPSKHDQGGWSQANYQRHHEAHVRWHLKRVAEALVDLSRRRPFDRLVLAGPEEATVELQRILPRAVKSRLLTTFPAEVTSNTQDILERTLEIERGIERTREEQLVDELQELAGADGLATCGVQKTLEAIWMGRVHELVVAEGVQLAGGECSACWLLVEDSPPACPMCGSQVTPLRDVIERAIERTLDEAGLVEVVHDRPARRIRESCGGLGALLRF
jgi:peptide subunit release factor 1 (eRF1)